MRVATVLLVMAAARAAAQSTSGLGYTEPAWSFQIGVGASTTTFGSSGYGKQTGALRAIDAGVRNNLGGAVDFRFDAWFVERFPPDDPFRYGIREPTSDRARISRTRFVAAHGTGILPVHITRDIVIEPSIGLGLIPVARGSLTYTTSTTPRPGAPGYVTSQGIMVSAGLGLRVGHFVVEQHVLQAMGADGALFNGENAPLMFAWRFY